MKNAGLWKRLLGSVARARKRTARAYNPFHVSSADAFRIAREYEDLRSAHRNNPNAGAYSPISSLPADKITLRRVMQYVSRSQSPVSHENALAFQDAYQWIAFFIDDRIVDAANHPIPAADIPQEALCDPIGSMNVAELLQLVTDEARNLKLEWQSFVESVERDQPTMCSRRNGHPQ